MRYAVTVAAAVRRYAAHMARYSFTFFSDAYDGVIRALVTQHDYLPVTLALEPGNRADGSAVAVVCALDQFAVGGVTMLHADGQPLGQRIGYIRRADTGKTALAASLATAPAPISGSLQTGPDGACWVFVEDGTTSAYTVPF